MGKSEVTEGTSCPPPCPPPAPFPLGPPGPAPSPFAEALRPAGAQAVGAASEHTPRSEGRRRQVRACPFASSRGAAEAAPAAGASACCAAAGADAAGAGAAPSALSAPGKDRDVACAEALLCACFSSLLIAAASATSALLAVGSTSSGHAAAAPDPAEAFLSTSTALSDETRKVLPALLTCCPAAAEPTSEQSSYAVSPSAPRARKRTEK